MNVKCPKCETILRVDEAKYSQESIIVQCPKCSQKIRVAIPKAPVSKMDYETKKRITDSSAKPPNHKNSSPEKRVIRDYHYEPEEREPFSFSVVTEYAPLKEAPKYKSDNLSIGDRLYKNSQALASDKKNKTKPESKIFNVILIFLMLIVFVCIGYAIFDSTK